MDTIASYLRIQHCVSSNTLGIMVIICIKINANRYQIKAGELMLRWQWRAIAQWSEHQQLKQESLGSIPGGKSR